MSLAPEVESSCESSFARDGYVVLRSMVDPNAVARMRAAAFAALNPLAGPAEYESDVGYPGAPASRGAAGGDTPRRLLFACSRWPELRLWATGRMIGSVVREVMGSPDIVLSQCHHNCVMTKHPGYSSRTAWHQDVRYWSFERAELVSSWLALGTETRANGALLVIPGSHRLDLTRERMDENLFLRGDLDQNAPLIDQAVVVTLEPGDVLLFHCRTLHAAGRNTSNEVKLSCVFTYHALDNRPVPDTRSAQYPSLTVGGREDG